MKNSKPPSKNFRDAINLLVLAADEIRLKHGLPYDELQYALLNGLTLVRLQNSLPRPKCPVYSATGVSCCLPENHKDRHHFVIG